MTWFLPGSLAAMAAVALAAALLRSRSYAIFRAVLLTLHSLCAAGLVGAFPHLTAVFLYLHVAVFVQAVVLMWPRMMPLGYRLFISLPAAFFLAGTILGWPWALLRGFGFEPWAPWLPYLVALFGLYESLSTRREDVHLRLPDQQVFSALGRARPTEPRERPSLRIAQITDPHLGPFMSVARLRRICERLAERQPDLVFLTGDFLTMESQSDPSLLAESLSPLSALEGRVFACFGNHDHEAPETVSSALERLGVQLLVDSSAIVRTARCTVQIVGFDFHWRGRRRHIHQVCATHPRQPGALRILLLHDPSAFVHVPDGEADLVLSGHTHGGQVGLVSLGLRATFLSIFARSPDHGLWGLGSNRLYVHRGTGHYGFPLRIGVPAEESVVHVHWASGA
jgi:predicted MPP superfamily phosphohydrolase